MKKLWLSRKDAKRVQKWWIVVHQCGWCGRVQNHKCKVATQMEKDGLIKR